MKDKDDSLPAALSTVVLGGIALPLDSERGREFIADCARNTEGLISDLEMQRKYNIGNQEWERLADNTHLLDAVRAERERRILSGESAREAAQRHFAKAPDVLNRILTDEETAPRHRIEAARELRQAAVAGPDIEPGPKKKFTITINLGADTEVYEKWIDPRGPLLPDDGEEP
jgi:hypothetical protein